MRTLLIWGLAVGSIPISYAGGFNEQWTLTLAIFWPCSFLVAFLVRKRKGAVLRFALPILLSSWPKSIDSRAKSDKNTWASIWYCDSTAESEGPYLDRLVKDNIERHGYIYEDISSIDDIHCWSVFTMYWPTITLAALVGLETAPSTLERNHTGFALKVINKIKELEGSSSSTG